MNLDWHRLKAVVLESDDWGLCAWSPDEQAHRVLADTPAFRSGPGRRYGRSTLESAADVRALVDLLLGFRGADGFAPVWQANTIVAAPDYEAMRAPLFGEDPMPVLSPPDAPSRWVRPGLADELRRAESTGVWWAELHGLHHLPEGAWLRALRRGEDDARRAHEQQSPICTAVEASGEYDASEPRDVRARNLRRAHATFTARFGRPPTSFCPPDYRFDDWLESEAESLGLTTLQGKPEQSGHALAPLRRRWLGLTFPHRAGDRFYLPPRIAFEPRGIAKPAGPLGVAAVVRAARDAWGGGRPAIVSTHRLNYAHLDREWSEAGRSALCDLLTALCAEGAVFVTDAEVRALVEHGSSARPIGGRGALLRHYGVPREPVRVPAPAGVRGARLADGGADGTVQFSDGEAEARVNVGEVLIEWSRD